MTEDEMKQFKAQFHQNNEQMAKLLTDAMWRTYKQITGRPMSDRLHDKIYDAVASER